MNAPRNTQYRHLDVQKIAGSVGAEVRGVDLSQDVSDEVLAEIRAALLDNLVICIRDQDITPAQQLAFARRWGDIHLHPFMQGMADYPEILAIIKRPTDKKNFGGSWHTDQMFSPSPRWGRCCTRWRCPRPAATRCSPTNTSPTRACRTA